MRTFFYFELFHQAQDQQVLSLTQFPTTSLLPAECGISAKIISCGRSKTRKLKQPDALVAELSDSTFNSIEFISKFAPYSLAIDYFQVLSITRTLYISPTNSLWAATKDWPEQRSPLINREYHTLRSTENYLKCNDVTRYPTCLATTIEFDSSILEPLERDIVHRMLFNLLKASWPEVLVNSNIVGGGGIETFDMQTGSYKVSVAKADNALLKIPESYNLIGERFGVLQPLMIGQAHLCKEVAKILGKECDMALISFNKEKQGLLLVSQKALSIPEYATKSKSWFVPKVRDE